jgi:tetratricopeptide (TPR) repeat protein
MRRTTLCWCVAILLLSSPLPVRAQGKEIPKKAVTAPAKAKPGQAGSQQELDAYNRLHNEIDPAVKRNLIEKFASDFPASGLLAYVYQDGVYLGRQANNIDMIAEYGDKALELWPENYTLLTELGSVYVQRDRVDQAEVEATRALDLVGAADKPSGMTEQQWAEGKKMLLASNHSTLGFVHLRRAQASQDSEERKEVAEQALVSFKRAQEFHPIDEFTFYGLGFAFAILDDYPNAESNLAKAVAINGIVMASARSLLEEIYRSRHNQSLIGLEQVIAKAKAEIGLSHAVSRAHEI